MQRKVYRTTANFQCWANAVEVFSGKKRSGDLDTNVIWKKDWVEEKVVVFQKAERVTLQIDLQLGARKWQKSTASVEVWQQPITLFL